MKQFNKLKNNSFTNNKQLKTIDNHKKKLVLQQHDSSKSVT